MKIVNVCLDPHSIHMARGRKVELVKHIRQCFSFGLADGKRIADDLLDGKLVKIEFAIDDGCEWITRENSDVFSRDFGVLAVSDCVDPPSTIYVVMVNSDMVEGRGPMVIDSVFSSYEAAAEFIDYRPGIMGYKKKWSEGNCGDWQIVEMKMHNSATSRNDELLDAERKKALAKLTDHERKILGL